MSNVKATHGEEATVDTETPLSLKVQVSCLSCSDCRDYPGSRFNSERKPDELINPEMENSAFSFRKAEQG